MTTQESKKSHKPTYTATGKDHHQYKHGMGSTKNRNPLYLKWAGMKRRCLNKNDKAYKRYGGAGVTISPRWMSFQAFYEDMSPSYFKDASLDRINNNKGYSNQNCRWVKLSEQSRNRRNVILYELNGVKKTTGEWDKELGLKEGTVRRRILVLKWSIKKALTTKKPELINIFWDKHRSKWRVEIDHKGKHYFVGRYKTITEAKKARVNFIYNLLIK